MTILKKSITLIIVQHFNYSAALQQWHSNKGAVLTKDKPKENTGSECCCFDSKKLFYMVLVVYFLKSCIWISLDYCSSNAANASPLCPGALNVFGGGPDSALSVGISNGIGARSDGLTNNQSSSVVM